MLGRSSRHRFGRLRASGGLSEVEHGTPNTSVVPLCLQEHNFQNVKNTREDEEGRIIEQLKKARKRMRQHMKLQVRSKGPS